MLNPVRDIYYEGGYIFMLDSSEDGEKARLAVLTSAGLQAGGTTKLGDADLDLSGSHELFRSSGTYNTSSRMVVVGKTVSVHLRRVLGEDYDPIAHFSFN